MKRAPNPWQKLVAQEAAAASDSLARDRDRLLSFWGDHPWNWLTGIDPTTLTGEGLGPGFDDRRFKKGRPLIWTTDERDNEQPIKPFPERDYLFRYVETLMSERLILITKARQMYFSTITLLYMDWLCRFRTGRVCVLSKRTEDEAIKMLTEKTRRMHTRLPLWVQEKTPLKDTPRHILRYTATQSDTYAANERMAAGMARGGTASCVFVDEGAHQQHTGEIIAASLPMAAQLIVCSTPNIANAGGRAMKAIIDSVVSNAFSPA